METEGGSPEGLGLLETLADAQRWLRVIGKSALSDRLDKGGAQAATRALEVWIRAEGEPREERIEGLAKRMTSARQAAAVSSTARVPRHVRLKEYARHRGRIRAHIHTKWRAKCENPVSTGDIGNLCTSIINLM